MNEFAAKIIMAILIGVFSLFAATGIDSTFAKMEYTTHYGAIFAPVYILALLSQGMLVVLISDAIKKYVRENSEYGKRVFDWAPAIQLGLIICSGGATLLFVIYPNPGIRFLTLLLYSFSTSLFMGFMVGTENFSDRIRLLNTFVNYQWIPKFLVRFVVPKNIFGMLNRNELRKIVSDDNETFETFLAAMNAYCSKNLMPEKMEPYFIAGAFLFYLENGLIRLNDPNFNIEMVPNHPVCLLNVATEIAALYISRKIGESAMAEFPEAVKAGYETCYWMRHNPSSEE